MKNKNVVRYYSIPEAICLYLSFLVILFFILFMAYEKRVPAGRVVIGDERVPKENLELFDSSYLDYPLRFIGLVDVEEVILYKSIDKAEYPRSSLTLMFRLNKGKAERGSLESIKREEMLIRNNGKENLDQILQAKNKSEQDVLLKKIEGQYKIYDISLHH
jgi:hypothetical protein